MCGRYDNLIAREASRPLGWLPKPYAMAALVEVVQVALSRLCDEKA